MNLHELCGEADFVTKDGIIFNDDCINVLSNISSSTHTHTHRD